MEAQREGEILSKKYSHSQNVRYRIVSRPLLRCNTVVSMDVEFVQNISLTKYIFASSDSVADRCF